MSEIADKPQIATKPLKDLPDLQTLVALCKRRGFVFPSSEIYGGLNSCWDYGPLGIEVKKALKEAWWKAMVYDREDIEGIDAAILMHPRVWKASGHIDSFNDPLVDCKQCKARFRADHLGPVAKIEKETGNIPTIEEMTELLKGMNCPNCGSKGTLTEPRLFNMMFKSHMSAIEDEANLVYFRPETAQGIFVNFINVQQTCRRKLPFGIAQIGKSFRNEITPGNFIFRTREFEQMEMQFFIKPSENDTFFEEWKSSRMAWHESIGLRKEKLRWHQHGESELAHYCAKAFDVQYQFPFGWKELEGIHDRTDFDLKNHQEFSGKNLPYVDEEKNKFIPHVIETAVGCDRSILTVLADAYRFNDERVVMQLHPKMAPYKAAVFPLMKKPELLEPAQNLYQDLRKKFRTDFDVAGSIGKRYRRQEEIGTPYCITLDYESLEDKAVTIRHRDTMKQDRVAVNKVMDYVESGLENWE